MAAVKCLNQDGQEVGEVEIPASIAEAEIRKDLVHQAVVTQFANRRQGTADTKTRKEVKGGGRKPWRQKGTGRARAGSIRSPVWVGGGSVFGPHPRDFGKEMPKKMKRTAFRSALADAFQSDRVRLVEEFKVSQPKTREVAALVKAWGASKARSVLLVTAESDPDLYRAARNIPNVNVQHVTDVNVVDLVAHEKIFVERAAFETLEKRIAQ